MNFCRTKPKRRVDATMDKAAHAARKARRRATRFAEDLYDDLPETHPMLDEARTFARNNPLIVAGGAMVVGAVLATVLRRD